MMVNTSIALTEQEIAAIVAISEQTGITRDEVLREAVEQFIARFPRAGRRALLQQAQGMWRDRKQLPDVGKLRAEFERFTAESG